jgi:hypothetical protein
MNLRLAGVAVVVFFVVVVVVFVVVAVVLWLSYGGEYIAFVFCQTSN